MWPRLIQRWKGIALTLVGVVATLWLTLTGQLALYIHPRYFVFTAIMSVIGGLLALVALALAPDRDAEDHEHGSGHDEHANHDPSADAAAHPHRTRLTARRRRLGATGAVVSGTIVVGAVLALLVLPPAALTAQTAVDRDIDRTTADLAGDAPSLAGADLGSFTIKDWALLLRQSESPSAFSGQEVELTGFIAPAPGDPDDAFTIARFTVTCCAVDAQPIGITVHLPGWRERFAVDDWVIATGAFGGDPAGGEGAVLVPQSVEPTSQPEQPYVF
ncbi:TIGR03943 family putative permease subunit [Agromyces salentinus]|uniref:TIGR03943 family protein n=1 Tax=Agromyces salentinus TaxID=269421 RepID=A0ABN2MPX2_9MICO|nr:TIGR03943 family protein [Agromyces salentinus]